MRQIGVPLLMSDEIIRCVTCNVACDSSGLCNDHRYDEQPRQPGWLREQIERSTRRLEQIPAWARPKLIRREDEL